MKYLLILILLTLIFLTGCSLPPFKPTSANKIFTVEIIIDNNIIFKDVKVAGLASCANDYCVLRVPSIEYLDDEDWYIWGKELGHGYFGDYHKGIVDIY